MIRNSTQRSYRSSYKASLPDGLLHFAAHSHHPWPDVTRSATLQYWDDSARLLDHKWQHVFDNVLPNAANHIAKWIGHPSPERIAFGPNTLDLVFRAMSPLLEKPGPLRILTTDSEFYSFDRLLRRLEEGSDRWQVTRIPTAPCQTFVQRWHDALAKPEHGKHWDMIYVSQVFFNSGFAPRPLFPEGLDLLPNTLCIVDGYHGFGALPFQWDPSAHSTWKDIFYVSGGYKYAQSGEGACFMITPEDHRLGLFSRPITTGWLTGWKDVANHDPTRVAYGSDGFRFLGATFDPTGLYRLNAVFDWFNKEAIDAESIHTHVRRLQEIFLAELPFEHSQLEAAFQADFGHFISIRMRDEAEARALVHALSKEKTIVDHRGPLVRFGFGIYQSEDDVKVLLDLLRRNAVRK